MSKFFWLNTTLAQSTNIQRYEVSKDWTDTARGGCTKIYFGSVNRIKTEDPHNMSELVLNEFKCGE